ncbi:hypothetical protein DYB31_012753 [Aphanomyces astaci]|uniref:Nucleotide exchange factor SIL1 n=1 Tax=Aphanomyces astaci TaxID=112090 RepID=A0A397FAW2_APHAT|nr:hypothetical protein DYB31_012753 [Aphanomyces astaci]
MMTCMPSKMLLLLCLAGLSLLAMHVHADNHAVALVPVHTDSCSADGGATCDASQTGKADDVAKTAIFEPTHEWKEIQAHEHIPGGLHVRMNLQTGLKEAKLLEDDANQDKAAGPPRRHTGITTTDIYHTETSISTDNNDEHDEASSNGAVRDASGHVIGESLYNVLAQLPEPPQLDGMNIHEAYGKLTKEQFSAFIAKVWKARQAELKEASAQIRDEVKYMQELIDTLVTPMTGDVDVHEANVIDALEKLEWEVQDLDKAKDFNTLGGLEATVHHLNASSYKVRSMVAAWVVGSAVKHYEQAQTWALQAGAMPNVLHSLVVDPHEGDQADTVYAMQRKMLYALSALTQANDKAQALLLRNDGVHILANIMQDARRPSTLRHKALQLALHLVLEARTAASEDAQHPLHALHHAFTSPAFCEATKSFVQTPVCGDAIDLVAFQLPSCRHVYEPALLPTLHAINQTWFQDRDLDNEVKAHSMHKLAVLVQALQEPNHDTR